MRWYETVVLEGEPSAYKAESPENRGNYASSKGISLRELLQQHEEPSAEVLSSVNQFKPPLSPSSHLYNLERTQTLIKKANP